MDEEELNEYMINISVYINVTNLKKDKLID